MPTLLNLGNEFGKWGDGIMFRGRIYTLDDLGRIHQFYGPDDNPEKYSDAGNDDGRESSCVELAFGQLGIDTTMIREFKAKMGQDVSVPWDLTRPVLRANGFEQIEYSGLVAEFLKQYQQGKFYVSSTDYKGY